MNNITLVNKMNKRLMSASLEVVQRAESKSLNIAINPKGTGENTAVFMGRKLGKPVTTVPEIKDIISEVAEKKEWLTSEGMKLKYQTEDKPKKAKSTKKEKDDLQQ